MPSSGLERLVLREYWRWERGDTRCAEPQPELRDFRPKAPVPPHCRRLGRSAGCTLNPEELG